MLTSNSCVTYTFGDREFFSLFEHMSTSRYLVLDIDTCNS